jgi:hypothetical protein
VKENEVEDLKAYVSELQIKHKKDIKNLEEKLSKSAEKSKKYIKEIEEQLLTANKEVEKVALILCCARCNDLKSLPTWFVVNRPMILSENFIGSCECANLNLQYH